MTVKEMHIDIEQATQQVAANRGRKFLPEEIDWILNKVQDRFILSCLVPSQDGSGGFQLDQTKADRIRMLITSATLQPYVDNDERYKCFLPANYKHLLGDWSYTVDKCGSAAEPVSATHTQFITRLRQEHSQGTTPFYGDVILQMPDATVTIPDDLAFGHSYEGFPELTDIDFLTNWILWKARTVYWERFDDYYYPSHYVAVRTSAYGGAVALTIDGDVNTTETVVTRTLTYHTGTGVRHNNRLVNSAMIPSLNESSWWKSSHYSPISALEGANLYIHRDNSFIVTGTGITYVRKPQPISLSLNSGCELAGDSTHRELCDLATEYIKGTAQNAEGRQLKTQDIAQRVIL